MSDTVMPSHLQRFAGVESSKIDYCGQKVTVTGNVDKENVWRHIRKTGKRVALISKPEPPKEEPKKAEKKVESKEVKKEDEKERDNKLEEKNAVPIDEKKQEKTEETEETNLLERKEVNICMTSLISNTILPLVFCIYPQLHLKVLYIDIYAHEVNVL